MNLNQQCNNSITQNIKDGSTKDKSEGNCKESLENKSFIPFQKQQIRSNTTSYAHKYGRILKYIICIKKLLKGC